MSILIDFCFVLLQDKCHEVADKYIEFEPIVIVIDLILLSRPTYRHILYNTNFKVEHTINSLLCNILVNPLAIRVKKTVF